MADPSTDEREALARLFPNLPRFDLLPERTALIVIDMQYLDAHPDYGLGRRAKELGIAHLLEPYFQRCAAAAASTRRLLDLCREIDVEVIHVVIASYSPDAHECSLVSRLMDIRPARGSRETETLEELQPLEGEIVLPKITSSAFNSTPIDQMLRNMNRDTLLLCGVVTNGCVETTMRDARDLGYKCVLVSDACAAMTVEAHEQTIRYMSRTRGNARTAEDVIVELRSRATGEPALVGQGSSLEASSELERGR